MFSTKEFFAHIKKEGLARPNRFYVLMGLPNGINDPNNSKTLSLMCMQTELPSKTINVSETKYNGNIKKAAMSKLYYQQQFVFAVSSKMVEKELIDAWMELIIADDHELSYYDDYVTDIEVYQLDMQDKPVHAVKFKGCFPVVVNPLTLSNSDQNTTHQLMVQFAYESWETIQSTLNLHPGANKENKQAKLNDKKQKQVGHHSDTFSADIEGEKVKLNSIRDRLSSEKDKKRIDKITDTLSNTTQNNTGIIADDISKMKPDGNDEVSNAINDLTNKLKQKTSDISHKLSKLF